MNLTCPNNVKNWLNVESTDTDAMIMRLINSASNFILNYIQRPQISKYSYTEIRSGANEQRMLLRQYPVLAVASVQIDQLTVPAQNGLGQPGFGLDKPVTAIAGRPQSVFLAGYYRFCRGQANIQIEYTAGYCVQSEPQTVDSDALQITPNCPNGPWSQDDGVMLANGTALTRVDSNPGALQYTAIVNQSTGVCTYGFNAAQAGAAVLLNYSFIPADLENVCIELVGERYRLRDRIGVTSHSMSGQVTTAFSTKDMNDYLKECLQPFKLTVPI